MYESDAAHIDDTDDTTGMDVIRTSLKRGRERSVDSPGPDDSVDASPSATGTKRKAQLQHVAVAEDDAIVYGASRFGHFGEYMRRKRAKLQIQNVSMDAEASGEEKSNIFRGISVYVRTCVLVVIRGSWKRERVSTKRKNHVFR